MANYECTCRTNYFRVTNEERYQEIFSKLTAEDTIQDFSEEKDDGLYHGFGCYGCIEWDDFIEELQEILPEDEAFMLFEAGNEKLRYVTGFVTIVTKRDMRTINMVSEGLKAARELLDNPGFDTQVDY